MGYSFDGWYTEKDGGTRVTESSYVQNDNQTLWAHYSYVEQNLGGVPYRVSYHPGRGDGFNCGYNSSGTLVYDPSGSLYCNVWNSTVFIYGTGKNLMTISETYFTKEGHDFVGWDDGQ